MLAKDQYKDNEKACVKMWNSMKVRAPGYPRYKQTLLSGMAKYYYSDAFVDSFLQGIRIHELYDINNEDMKSFDTVDIYNTSQYPHKKKWIL